MINPMYVSMVISFVGYLLLGQTLINIMRDHSTRSTNNLENPF